MDGCEADAIVAVGDPKIGTGPSAWSVSLLVEPLFDDSPSGSELDEQGHLRDGLIERAMDGQRCPICHRTITVEAGQRRPNDPGDHDPAHHVAQAYHVACADGTCWSCGEPFPCETRRTYGATR